MIDQSNDFDAGWGWVGLLVEVRISRIIHIDTNLRRQLVVDPLDNVQGAQALRRLASAPIPLRNQQRQNLLLPQLAVHDVRLDDPHGGAGAVLGIVDDGAVAGINAGEEAVWGAAAAAGGGGNGAGGEGFLPAGDAEEAAEGGLLVGCCVCGLSYMRRRGGHWSIGRSATHSV